MSRRERERGRDRDRDRDPDSNTKRHRSGFDNRESSPKRSRRDGKPEIERVSETNPESKDHTDRVQMNHRRLQDALPLVASTEIYSKIESGLVAKKFDKKMSEQNEGVEKLYDPTEVPRSRSYFQHDERGNIEQVGRSFGQRATEHRSKNLKDEQDKRTTNKLGTLDSRQREQKSESNDRNGMWGHDGFLKLETEPPSPARKRPPFREKKVPMDNTNNDKVTANPVRVGNSVRPVSGGEKRDERDHNPRYSDKSERSFSGNRGDAQRHSLLPRERYRGGGSMSSNYRGRDRLSEKQGYHPRGRGEKWKHDLFDEANKSQSIKNEEDQIAKVEALLAS
ncbi:hypothetical protein K2173_002212 [Erythroxylum novogranatense]|uniref:Btz domain-containing protein n=1 Tax=Erythroxylum novogranatense TaxID=1862640 RepID=A0AAV8TAI6_9ROSI|nr:hypothetical protein K2173_002212 [Erythroxylum novogranatense]